eukprot:2881148-Prymnesium_polylepis.1
MASADLQQRRIGWRVETGCDYRNDTAHCEARPRELFLFAESNVDKDTGVDFPNAGRTAIRGTSDHSNGIVLLLLLLPAAAARTRCSERRARPAGCDNSL